MWHVTHKKMTYDMFWGVNILSQLQLSSSYSSSVLMFWRSGGKEWVTDSMNELKTKVFVEQPRLHQVFLLEINTNFWIISS